MPGQKRIFEKYATLIILQLIKNAVFEYEMAFRCMAKITKKYSRLKIYPKIEFRVFAYSMNY